MYIVLGGTGRLGSALATTLLERGHAVTLVTRDATKAAGWAKRGAKLAQVDVHDSVGLRRVLQGGKRAYLVNPSAAPSTDTDAEERSTVAAILAALDGSGLEKVVAASTYGAQRGERCGDLTTLFELEEGLQAQPIPAAIVRGAYYFSNLEMGLEAAKAGTLPTMVPADQQIPMVAPSDLGRFAAGLLTAGVDEVGVHHVEGPERYSWRDVADAFGAELGRKVELEVIPRERWEATFKALGFSDPAASSYARMTAALVDSTYQPDGLVRGSVTLREYISKLVKGAS
jgi:uncharacterized protein YbjT (DUF2867 family)